MRKEREMEKEERNKRKKGITGKRKEDKRTEKDGKIKKKLRKEFENLRK